MSFIITTLKKILRVVKMAQCNICGRVFSRHSNMLRHKQNIHEKEPKADTEDISQTDESAHLSCK